MRSQSPRSSESSLPILICCLLCLSGLATEKTNPPPAQAKENLALYRKTNDQVGHEFVKTEQFLVPAGSAIVIQGLQFAPGSSTLTQSHKHILQQVFNSIEEITENTVDDTNLVLVAEHKKMEFAIRGYPDDSPHREANLALAEQRAKTVLKLLTDLGVPPWRLKATGLPAQGRKTGKAAAEKPKQPGRVEFIRTR